MLKPPEKHGFVAFKDVLGAELTLGADPEIFMASEGRLIPAFKFLPNKHQSKVLFWDGFQAEFTVRPSPSVASICGDIRARLAELLLRTREKYPKADFLLRDAIWVDDDIMAACSDEEAALGCDPSQNVYGAGSSMIPSNPRILPLRFAGAHIHFGHPSMVRPEGDDTVVWNNTKLIQALDTTVGLWSVALDSYAEGLRERRSYYGLAGEFRNPQHGIEWRTLSNFWLASPEIAWLTLNFAKAIFFAWRTGQMAHLEVHPGTAVTAINTYQVGIAREYLRMNEPWFEMVLTPHLCKAQRRLLFDLAYEGVQAKQPNHAAVAANWKLDKETPCQLDWTNATMCLS